MVMNLLLLLLVITDRSDESGHYWLAGCPSPFTVIPWMLVLVLANHPRLLCFITLHPSSFLIITTHHRS